MKLYAPSTIREIRDRFGFRFSKSLGQNFLTDKNIIDQILEGSGITGDDLVIEIGPGIGVITREAAQLAHKVIAIEIDTNLIPILNRKPSLLHHDAHNHETSGGSGARCVNNGNDAKGSG